MKVAAPTEAAIKNNKSAMAFVDNRKSSNFIYVAKLIKIKCIITRCEAIKISF